MFSGVTVRVFITSSGSTRGKGVIFPKLRMLPKHFESAGP